MTIPNHHKNFFIPASLVKRFYRAFTLVEVLLVVSLFSVTSIAIYQTFSSGLRIWDYASKFFPEEDVLLSLERMTHDLHNAFYYSIFEFKGDEHELEFTTIVTTAADPNSGATDSYVQQVGRVRYIFDEERKQIVRQQADYSQSVNKKWQSVSVLVSGVDKVSLTYLYRSKNRLIEQMLAKGVMPAMIRVKIDYQAEKEVRQMIRLIDIPASLSSL